MVLSICFSVLVSVCFPTAASTDPLNFLLRAARSGLLRFLLQVVRTPLLMPGLLMAANDCCEGRRRVKVNLMFEAWLKADERCSNTGSNASKRDRWPSMRYETAGTSVDLTSENFQNTGAFIVVRSSVFSLSSAQNTHLARDAYNAYSRRAGRRQVQFIHW
ncbi:MAG: hypothetical protein QM501_04675 [Gimesia sp.]